MDTLKISPSKTELNILDTYRRGSYARCLCCDARALLGIPKPLCATGGVGKGLVSGRDHLDLRAGDGGEVYRI